MRHVDFDPSRLRGKDATWWQQWSARAEAETQLLIKARLSGKGRGFNPVILSELKEWLLHNVFYNKCALCEYDVVSDYYYGDSEEHYRPKSEVTEEHDGRIEPVLMPDGHPHPGYYWVAYDWRNMFPLCARCRRNGKGTQFPIDAERVSDPRKARDTETLNQVEAPQLLNPYKDYPTKHLKFGVKGAVTALSRNGQATIKALCLSGEAFASERQRQQEMAWSVLQFLIDQSARQARPIGELLERCMESYTGPKAPFSQAVSDYLDIKLA